MRRWWVGNGKLAVGLAGWGTLLAWLGTGDRLASLLIPSFQPLVPVAAVVLYLMAAGLLFLPGKKACGCCGHDHGRDADHHHGPGWWALAVLLLPAWGAVLMRPEGYGLQAVLRRGIVSDPAVMEGMYRTPSPPDGPLPATTEDLVGTAADFLDQIPKTRAGAWPMVVPDLLYAMEDEELRAKLETGKVEVVGQRVATDRDNPRGNRLLLIRLMMVCCAADARPMGVLVEFPGGLPAGEEMEWLKVEGRVVFPLEGGRRMALLVADDVQTVPPPKDIYVY